MNIQQVKKNKKGFTIIELVIVIAVIAILAAVLIPTFTTVIGKSHQSNAVSRAKSAYTEIIASKNGGSPSDFNASFKVQVLQNGKVYEIPIKADGQLNVDAVEETNAAALGTSKLPTGYPAETFADVQIVAAS